MDRNQNDKMNPWCKSLEQSTTPLGILAQFLTQFFLPQAGVYKLNSLEHDDYCL